MKRKAPKAKRAKQRTATAKANKAIKKRRVAKKAAKKAPAERGRSRTSGAARGRGTRRGARRSRAAAILGLREESRGGVAGLRAVAASRESDGISVAEVERRRVYDTLRIKLRSLNESADYLESVRLSITKASERIVWLDAKRDIEREQRAVRQRLEALRAQGRVRDPGSAEERRLLDAIAAVGRTSNITAAFVTIVGKILDVVAAYKAETT